MPLKLYIYVYGINSNQSIYDFFFFCSILKRTCLLRVFNCCAPVERTVWNKLNFPFNTSIVEKEFVSKSSTALCRLRSMIYKKTFHHIRHIYLYDNLHVCNSSVGGPHIIPLPTNTLSPLTFTTPLFLWPYRPLIPKPGPCIWPRCISTVFLTSTDRQRGDDPPIWRRVRVPSVDTASSRAFNIIVTLIFTWTFCSYSVNNRVWFSMSSDESTGLHNKPLKAAD